MPHTDETVDGVLFCPPTGSADIPVAPIDAFSPLRNHDVPMLLVRANDGGIIDATVGATRFYGFGHDTLCTMRIGELCVEELDRLRDLDSGSPQFVQHRMADGATRVIELHASSFGSAGSMLLLVVVREIIPSDVTEATIARSEERWRTALESADHGLWDWDVPASKVYFSSKWKSMLGYEDHEIADDISEWQCRVHPDDLDQCYIDINRHIEGETEHYVNEHRLRCKDGTYRWILDRGQVIEWTEEGKPKRFIGTHTDITDRKDMETRLQSSEALFRSYFDAELVGMAISSAEKGWVQYNQRFCDILGYSYDEIAGLSWPELTHPDDLAKDTEQFNRILAGEIDAYRMEKRYLHKDGHCVYADLSVRALRKPDGTVDGLVGMIQDITDVKAAEADLDTIRKRLTALMAASPVVTYALAPGFDKLSFISENVIQNTGFEAAELQHDVTVQANRVHPEDRPAVAATVANWLSRGASGVVNFRYRFKRKDGTWVWLEDRIIAIRDDAGNVLEYVGASVDVTLQMDSTRLLERVAANVPGFIYQYRIRPDRSAHYPYASEGIADIYGVRPEDVREDASKVDAAIHPDDRPKIQDAIRHSIKTLEPWYCEYRVMRANGDFIWVEGNATPERQPDGSTLWHGYITDTTSRKEAEETLAKFQSRLKGLVETSQIVTYSSTPDQFWSHEFVSENVQTLTGFASEEVTGNPQVFFSSVPEKDAGIVSDTFARWLADGANGLLSLQYRFRRKDGRWIWMENRFVAVRNAAGEIAEFVGAMFDITAQVESMERLKNISRHVPGVLYEFRLAPDGSMAFPYVSDGTEDIFGVNPDAVLEDAQAAFGLILPEDMDRVMASILHSAETLSPWHDEFRVELPNRGLAWIDGHATPHPDPDGSITWYGYLSDDTIRKQAQADRVEFERRLQYAQKLESLGVLASGVAHDFNNLLMAVLGNLDIAATDLPTDTTAQVCVKEAMDAARRAAELTRQLLIYSGNAPFAIKPLDLNGVLRENAKIIHAAVTNRIDLRFKLSDDIPPIAADAGQVLQTILNLVTNATEAIGDNFGSVVVRTGYEHFTIDRLEYSRLQEKPAPGEFAFLTVTDSGEGMDEAALQRVFDPFYTTRFIGRGLGMSAVSGIVRAHHGAIYIESTPGKGTSVTVLFPLAGAGNSGAATGRSESDASPSAVVIADSDYGARSVASRIVDKVGWRSFAAANGAEVLEILANHPAEVACVLLDSALPGPRLSDLTARIRHMLPDSKIIVTSKFAPEVTRAQFEEWKPDGIVQKPFDVATLRQELERHF